MLPPLDDPIASQAMAWSLALRSGVDVNERSVPYRQDGVR
jgi:hypothetical protein